MELDKRTFLMSVTGSLAFISGCMNQNENSKDETDKETSEKSYKTTSTQISQSTTKKDTTTCETSEADDLFLAGNYGSDLNFSVVITDSDTGEEIFNQSYNASSTTNKEPSSGIFKSPGYYDVNVSIREGNSKQKTVEISGTNWETRVGVYVEVESDNIVIEQYHADPPC